MFTVVIKKLLVLVLGLYQVNEYKTRTLHLNFYHLTMIKSYVFTF